MDLISSLFLGAGLVVIGCLVALGVIVWQVLRSVQISDQLYLPFTADEYADWDDRCTRFAYERTRERASDE